MEINIIEIVNFLTDLSQTVRETHQFKVIKGLFIFYLAVVVLALVIMLLKYPSLKTYLIYGGHIEDRRKKRKAFVPRSPWEKIQSKLNSHNPNEWKLAIIEADKLLDKALEDFGAPGFSTGDKLKNVTQGDMEGNLDQAWQAHKVRNNIVHHPDFELDNNLASRTIKQFRDACEALKKG
ncbi:MAG: hypothetical protein GF335_04065 [Candidatus Moranbacteria bacterium]|nr:hypothetical protein [Candidatus Moranbacteria bacterium]